MKKEMIITVFIVIGIFVTSYFTQKYTNKSISDINYELENIKNEVIEDNSSEILQNRINNTYEKWEEKYEILSFYLEHNELEKVNTQLKLIKGHFEADDTKEALAEIENCLYVLEHLKDKQKLNLKNIF